MPDHRYHHSRRCLTFNIQQWRRLNQSNQRDMIARINAYFWFCISICTDFSLSIWMSLCNLVRYLTHMQYPSIVHLQSVTCQFPSLNLFARMEHIAGNLSVQHCCCMAAKLLSRNCVYTCMVCPLGRFYISEMSVQLVLWCFLLMNICTFRISSCCITLHVSEA